MMVLSAPDVVPPNSPDLIHVDYRIWGVLQEQVYCVRCRWVETTSVWQLVKHPAGIIDQAIDQWWVRL